MRAPLPTYPTDASAAPHTDPAGTCPATAALTEFIAAEQAAERLQERLHGRLPAHQRARLLFDLAVQYAVQADTHNAAFGPRDIAAAAGRSPIDADDTRDMATALADTAVLVSAVAATEHALTRTEQSARRRARYRVRATDPRLEQAAGPILDRLAVTCNRFGRARLLDELYDAVTPTVGRYAAELVASLSTCYATAYQPGRIA